MRRFLVTLPLAVATAAYAGTFVREGDPSASELDRAHVGRTYWVQLHQGCETSPRLLDAPVRSKDIYRADQPAKMVIEDALTGEIGMTYYRARVDGTEAPVFIEQGELKAHLRASPKCISTRSPAQAAGDQQAATKRRAETERQCSALGYGVGSAVVGMSAESALKCGWGKPQKVNRTTNGGGTREQWVYGGGNYLYFENGKLTTIQN